MLCQAVVAFHSRDGCDSIADPSDPHVHFVFQFVKYFRSLWDKRRLQKDSNKWTNFTGLEMNKLVELHENMLWIPLFNE